MALCAVEYIRKLCLLPHSGRHLLCQLLLWHLPSAGSCQNRAPLVLFYSLRLATRARLANTWSMSADLALVLPWCSGTCSTTTSEKTRRRLANLKSTGGSASPSWSARLWTTAMATMLDSAVSSLMRSPNSRAGKRRFHTPYCLSTVLHVGMWARL